MKQEIKVPNLGPHQHLYRCTNTGIAWAEDGSTGAGHSAHPNIHATGSVRGMKQRGYWDPDDVTVRAHGWIYNTSVCIVDDYLDGIACEYCRCGGNHERCR